MVIRKTSLLLFLAFTLLLVLLANISEALVNAHIDETIHKFTSDGGIYYQAYNLLYAEIELLERPALFLVGSPILFLKLANGELLYVQVFNLCVMAVSLLIARNCFTTITGRMSFLIPALCFPYFLFGFLGLNKEIYAMSASIIYGSYMIRGNKTHLAMALVLAAFARYYMLVALLILTFVVPRDRPPRYWLAASLLVLFSLAAPIAKYSIPEYSAEDLVDDYGGTIGNFFFWTIDHFGYALIYPLKYIFLMLTRAYGFAVGASEDLLGGVVSLFSITITLVVVRLALKRKELPPTVYRLFAAGILAPIPIMWSEIMHWRYFSFVYFFFLYGLSLNSEIARNGKIQISNGK